MMTCWSMPTYLHSRVAVSRLSSATYSKYSMARQIVDAHINYKRPKYSTRQVSNLLLQDLPGNTYQFLSSLYPHSISLWNLYQTSLYAGSVVQQLQNVAEKERAMNRKAVKSFFRCTHFLAPRHISSYYKFREASGVGSILW